MQERCSKAGFEDPFFPREYYQRNCHISKTMTPSLLLSARLGNQLLNDLLMHLVQSQKVEYEKALSKAVDKTNLAPTFKEWSIATDH